MTNNYEIFIANRDKKGELDYIELQNNQYSICKIDDINLIASMACSDDVLYCSSLTENNENKYSAYTINNKSISLLNTVKGVGNDATCIIYDKYNRKLVISDFLLNSIIIKDILNDGRISESEKVITFKEKGSNVGPRQDKSHPHCCIPIDKGELLAVADLGCDKIRLINKEYQEISFVNTTKGSGPRLLVEHPYKQLLYCISEISSEIFVCSYKDNKLNIIQSFSNLLNSKISESIGGCIAINHAGSLVVASNRGENNLLLYRVKEDGKLELIQEYKTDGWIRNLYFVNSDNLLIAQFEEYLDVGVYSLPKERCISNGGIGIFDININNNRIINYKRIKNIKNAYAFSVKEK